MSRRAWVEEARHRLPISLGRSLLQARRRLGLSQQAVAARVGISRPFLSQLEAGQRAPSVEVAAELGLALRLSDAERAELFCHAQLAGRSSPHRTGAWT